MSSSQTAVALDVLRMREGLVAAAVDQIAVECPIALEYNGISHAVMLATPADLTDFAFGFSLAEGIIGAPEELFDVEERSTPAGLVLSMSISSRQFERLKDRRRSFAGRTGCGLCGVEALDQLAARPSPITGKRMFSRSALLRAVSGMTGLQPLQEQTGATHAAAWLDASGTLQLVREDVGRHNALDKLIGAVSRSSGMSFGGGALLMTSRASMEIVQKAATVGVGHIAAISAPTSMAVEMARACGITLLGFLRGADHVVYAHEQDLSD
jgi:FdhD protein